VKDCFGSLIGKDQKTTSRETIGAGNKEAEFSHVLRRIATRRDERQTTLARHRNELSEDNARAPAPLQLRQQSVAAHAARYFASTKI